jgi:D-aspartate ligase
MKEIDTSIPVVLFRAENHTSLGIVRSLGRMGVKVFCIDHDRAALAMKSRYCAGRFYWDTDSSPPNDTVQYLLSVAKMLDKKAILLPTFDTRSLLVDQYRSLLSQSFILPQPETGALLQLYSKQSMYELCMSVGIPTPKTHFSESHEQALICGKELGFPLVIKGIDADRLMHRAGCRIAIVHDQFELSKIYEELDEPGFNNLALQEYIPWEVKDAWVVSSYFDTRGECRFAITGHKLRQLPITGGVTTFGECVYCESIVDSICRIAKAARYQGIIDADFIYDKRDGLWKLLDINPRPGANFRLSVDANGLDVVRTMYLDLSGQYLPSVEASWGRRWMLEDKDLAALRDYSLEGSLTICDWLRSIKSVSEFGHIALDDLRPSIIFLNKLVKYYLRGLYKRFLLLIKTRCLGISVIVFF